MALFNKTTKPEKKAAPKKEAPVEAATKELYTDEPKKKAETKKTAPASRAYHILVRPLVSEKASQQQAANQYFFEVAIDSNRIEIARAIKDVYGIAPVKVNIIRVEGKRVSRGRQTGRRKDWKKAIVTLPAGKTISLYEGV